MVGAILRLYTLWDSCAFILDATLLAYLFSISPWLLQPVRDGRPMFIYDQAKTMPNSIGSVPD